MSAKSLLRHAEINDANTSYSAICLDESYLYATESTGNTFLRYDLTSGKLLNTPLGIVAGSAAITLVGAATALVFSSTTSRVDFVNIPANTVTSTVSGANVIRSSAGSQQAAGMSSGPSSGIALATRSTNNSLIKVVLSTQVVSTISPAFGTHQATCILADESSGVWFAGTDGGQIFEITSTGTINKTITLPTTPNNGTVPVLYVAGITFNDPYLTVSTMHGVIYHYQYWSSTLLWKQVTTTPNSTGSPTRLGLCKSKNSLFSIGERLDASAVVGPEIRVFSSFNRKPIVDGSFFEDSAISTTTPRDALVNSSYLFYNVDNVNAVRIASFKFQPTSLTTLTTHCEYPVGVYVAGRIIRVRGTIGNREVEVDRSILAAEATLPIYSGRDYLEIALINPGTEKIDVREVTS